MLINLHLIIDLIQNTLTKLFQTLPFKIVEIEKRREQITLTLKDNEDNERKYQVTLYLKYDGRMNEFEIRSLYLVILDKSDGYFPVVIGSFTASNIIRFENALSMVIDGARFKAQEYEDL